jgi:hypothetical protein
MSLGRVISQSGPSGLDPAKLRAALLGAQGPAWGTDGRLACGAQPPFVALCGGQMRVEQVVDGVRQPAGVGVDGVISPARRLPAV